MRLFHAPLLAGVFALAAPAVAHAQGTHGFMLNGRLLGAALSVNPDEGDGETESGGGFGARLGYGFSDRFTVYAALDLAAIEPEEGADLLENETYGLGLIDIGVRANFPAGRTIVPYAEAALTGQGVVFDFEGTDANLTVSGGGITVGGGAQFFVSRTLAIDLGLDLTFGQFSDAQIDGEDVDIDLDLEDNSTVISRLGIGLSFYPSRTR